MKTLNPLGLNLQGNILIEASAGTGKTYNLAAIYLRLILGAGECAFEQGLPPEQILVLTFTNAATQELRERIYQKLNELSQHLQGAQLSSDAFIIQLTENLPANQRALYLTRCAAAAKQMDKAAIYTIHGFCQRVLKRFAFASGESFSNQLEKQDGLIKQQARYDFWRKFIQGLDQESAEKLIAMGIQNPANLTKLIKDLDDKTLTIEPQPIAQLLQAFDAEAAQKQQQVRKSLQADNALLWFEEQFQNKSLSKQNYKKNIMQTLEDFIAGQSFGVKELEKFTPAYLHEKAKAPLELLPCFVQMADYVALLRYGSKQRIVQMANSWISNNIEKSLDEQGKMTFDSLIDKLSKVLGGEQGNVLADQLYQAYPCLLVDEFQDTDAKQYGIFSAIFQQRSSAFVFLMIGDPKQAIYGFRGAEIQTYLQAKAQVTEANCYTLNTNYRSSPAMIAACNHLYLNSPLKEQLFNHQAIAYIEVLPAKAMLDNNSQHGIKLAHIEQETLLGSESTRVALADFYARQVVHLLELGEFCAADICLLVRNVAQAEALKAAMTRYQLDVVYLSEKNSVYQQDEAWQLLQVLNAVYQPHNAGLLRTALAVGFFNYSWQQLLDFQQDEAWQNLIQEFRELKQVWQTSGPLSMLHKLAGYLDLPSRQKNQRSLTNWFHLAELLQQASYSLDGLDAQMDYLQQAINGNLKIASDEQVIRLENERSLVKIMTMHGSKGLEFPVVFVPFACQTSESLADDIDEEMRLLYVAITRAKYACYLPVMRNKAGKAKQQIETGILGRLLFNCDSLDDAEIDQQLQIFYQHAHISKNPAADAKLFQAHEKTYPLANYLLPELRQPKAWASTSYSQISYLLSKGKSYSSLYLTDKEHDEELSAVETVDEQESIYHLPGSAALGILLHQLLQDCQAAGFAESAVPDVVKKRCQNSLWQEKTALFSQWLIQIISTPLVLGDASFCLKDLSISLAEDAFMMTIDQLDNQRISDYALQMIGENAEQVKKSVFYNGTVNGAIDLLLCWQDKYYVIDYKSNFLGFRQQDYHYAAMHQMLLQHRYDVQALIYQQALHRLLSQRLENYQAEQHLGGCAFFFLRGIEHDTRGIYFIPANSQLIEQSSRLFGER